MAQSGLFDLTGRLAVVTGGWGTYGAAISEGLAESNAFVVIASRNLAACEAEAKRLTARGLAAAAAVYDQSDASSILQFRDHVLATHGLPHIFVNNSVGRPLSA